MIPFENERSLTDSERYAKAILESEWSYVIRCTSGVKEDLEVRYPKIAEQVSNNIMEDTEAEFSNIFRPGVPDLMAFSDAGEYLFVEVKNPDDGLRNTQLRWLRDFKGINAEIWFADSDNEITDDLDTENISSFSFKDRKGSGQNEIKEGKKGFLNVELPKTLGSVIGIKEGDEVSWRLKSESELLLDSK